ncbi:hypothetical protein [Synechococcus sp. Nb3U1]|uniref:hypothetical protein n=1 Tax=Synechococcus sp. Nb3U1 TaxID=1914529 RepID=UPI001F4578E9|nr:hypothetical protein [Synechococcus sp. Nb3U1]
MVGLLLGAIVGATATGRGVAELELNKGGTPLVVSLLQPPASAIEAQVAKRERPPRQRAEPESRLIEKFSTHSHQKVLDKVQQGSNSTTNLQDMPVSTGSRFKGGITCC